MLCLTTKKNERIVFELPDGSRIEIYLKETRGTQATICMLLPKEVNVKREKYER